MKKASLRLHLVAWCFCVILCALLCPRSAQGQITVHSFNQVSGGPFDWNSSTPWYQTPFSGFPNGIGAIATLNTDITANVTLQLRDGLNITLGGLTLGDLSGGNTFTISSLGSEKLIFDTASGASAVLGKTISGQTEVINSGINFISDLDVLITTGAVTVNGVIEGAGGLNKWGNGVMTMTGANTYTGPTNINNTGSSTLRLNSASGLAINSSEVRIGNATSDGRGQARLELQRSDQILDTAILRFEAASSNNSYFKLLGFNETVGGILDTTGQGVIENMEGEAIGANSVLTVNTANSTDDFYFNGFFRNRASGTALGTIGLVKDGPGALTLTGGNIRYSGNTVVNDGTLTLSTTNTLPSVITLNGDSRLVLDNGGDFRFLNTINLGPSSTATIEKTGGGNLILGQGQRAGTTTPGSTTITGILAQDLVVGMPISGTNIPASTTITSIDLANQTITINNPATGTGAATNTFTFTDKPLLTIAAPFTAFGGTVTIAGNTTFNAGYATDGSNLTVNSGDTMTVNGDLNFTEGLTLTQSGTLQVNGNMLLSGAGGLANPPNANYTGSGSTTVTGTLTVNNISRNPNTNPNVDISAPFSVGGAITLNSGITRLINSGAFTGAYPSVTLTGGGSLVLEGTGAANRIGDSVPFNSGGGSLTFRHGTGSSETLGALNLQAGRLQVAVNSINSGDTATLTFASLSRVANLGATVNFAATDAGSPTANTNLGGVNKVVFTSAPVMDDGIIGGWASHGVNWAKYTANGVEPFVVADYATVDTGLWTTATAFPNPNATQNIRVNGFAPANLAANRAINSLNLQDGTVRTLNLNTNVLSIEAGGILASGNNHTISGSGASRLTVGVAAASTAELFMNVESGRNLTVSTIVGNWTDVFSTARTSGNNVLTGIGTTAGMRVGMSVTGTGIPANTTITEVISATSVRISNNATNGVTGNLTYNGGAVALVKTGPGTVTLQNTGNTYSGGTFINEGVVAINADTSLGVIPGAFDPDNVVLNGGTLRANGALTMDPNRGLTVGSGGGVIDVFTAGQVMEIPSVITGNGVLTKVGTGTLTLSGSGTLGTPMKLLALINDGAGTAPDGSPANADDDGILNITGSNIEIGPIDHNNGITNIGGLTSTNVKITGNVRTDVSGSAALTQLNFNGGVTLQGELLVNGIDLVSFSNDNDIQNSITVNSGKLSIGGNNLFSGTGITMNGGTLEIASPSALNSPVPLIMTVNGGSLQLAGVDFLIGDLRGAASTVEATGAMNSTLIVDTKFNSTYSGTISQSGAGYLGLTKQGPGQMILTSTASDYLGPTRIEGGILDASYLDFGFSLSSIGASGPEASNLVIASGGALRYSGTFTLLTDRSLTVGVGADGGAIMANGATRSATIEFGIVDQFGTTDQIAIEGSNDNGENAILVLGGYGTGDNIMNLELMDAAGQANLGLKKTGSGTWLLGNPDSSFSDETVILEGVLGILANNALGSSSSGTYVYGGSLDLRNVNYTTAETAYLLGGGLAASGGASTWAGGVVANSTSTIRVPTGSSLTINGALMGHGPINQTGEGTVILRGANSHANDTSTSATSGNYTVSAGRLILDYSAQNNSKLGDRGRLVLGGGRLGGILEMQNGTHGEIVAGVTIGAGSNQIIRNGGTAILHTNNLTRSAGGTVDFSASGIATTDTPNTVAGATGILGGWATIAGTDWATNTVKTISPAPIDGLIVAYTGYVNDVWASGNQTTVTMNSTQTGATTNTLRFNDPVDAVITLNGTNTINAAAILVTPNVGTHNSTIEGPGSLRALGAATDLIVSQYDQNGLLHISAPITNTSTGAAQGLIKNGPGALLLTGANTFTGVVALNQGTLCIKTIADGGVASPLGASTNAAGNLVFNGGILQYAGSDATTNRGFTVNFDALIDVTNENTTLTMSGGVAGTDSITKLGAGTLRLTGSATGITNYLADQGRISLVLNTGNNRFASNLGTLNLRGGSFEIVGDPGTSRSQELQGGLFVQTGASEIRVSSDGLGIVTTLTLGAAADPQDPADTRQPGGTVLFTENPTNGGSSNIQLHVPAIVNATVLPWAVYQNLDDLSQPGVNNFAEAVGVANNIISADFGGLHEIGSFFNNPANWLSGHDVSEGVDSFNGSTGSGTRQVRTIRYFDQSSSLITVTDRLDIRSGAILIGNVVGNFQKTITGGQITSNLSNAEGTMDLILHNYNTRSTFMIGSAIVNRPSGGASVNLVQTGTGTTALSGTNTYSGNTYVHGGVLRLDSATAVPGGIGVAGGTSHIVVEGGVIGLNNGNFSRDVGLGVEDIEFRGSGGFAAYTTDRTVNIGGASAGLTWGGGQFLPEGGTLILGSRDANATVDFQNPIALGVKDRVVRVQNGSDTEDGLLSGALSGTAGVVKADTGTLRVTGNSTFAGGVSLVNGALIVGSNTGLGTGELRIGTTSETQADDFLDFTVDSALVANSISVGNVNSSGITTISMTASSTLSGAIALGKDVFISPDAGVTSNLTGDASGPGTITLLDEGALRLSGTNSFGTSGGLPAAAIDGGTVIRSGTLQVGSSGALGATTVELGDVAPIPLGSVDRATTGTSITLQEGRFEPFGNGFVPSGGPGAFVFADTSVVIDGFAYGPSAVGTRVLIKDEDLNPERNGIYQFVLDPDGPNAEGPAFAYLSLVRVADLDTGAEMAYSTTTTIANGSSAGSTYFLAAAAPTPNTSPVLWKRDVVNPNVALLMAANGVNAPNAVDVNATNGSGTTTMGGAASFTTGTSTFSGPVTLRNVRPGVQELETLQIISSATGGEGVVFAGVISEENGGAANDVLSLVKSGLGVATLSGANLYTGNTVVNQGTLLVNNLTGSGTSAGTVTVNGGATLGGIGTIAGNTTVSGTVGNNAVLSPGTPSTGGGMGTLTFGQGLTFGANSEMAFTVGEAVSGLYNVSDRVVANALTIDSSTIIKIFLDSLFTPDNQVIYTYNLFDWTTLSTDGDLVDQLQLPTLTGGSTWDTSLLNSQGIISIAPEPGRVILLAFGAAGMLLRRRRK